MLNVQQKLKRAWEMLLLFAVILNGEKNEKNGKKAYLSEVSN